MQIKKETAFIIASLLVAQSASADWQLPTNPGLPSDFDTSIVAIIDWLLGFIATLSVLVIIYGGVIYVASTGDPTRVQSAKNTVKYAIMGLAMAGIAYAAVTLVVNTLHA